MPVSRFGVSLEEELLKALDDYVQENQFSNRSQAIRHLIEKNLVEKKWKCDNIVAGAIVLSYNQGKNDIHKKLVEIEKAYYPEVLSSQQFYLDETKTLEVISVKGPSHLLTELSDKLISVKGIQHGKLVMSKID